jgi:hypothetical protein
MSRPISPSGAHLAAVPVHKVEAASLEGVADPVATKPQHTEFEALLDEIIKGRLPIPHFEPMDPSQGIASIAAGSGLQVTQVAWGATLPGAEGRGHFARFFLNTTQGGQFDGTGLVMLMTGDGGKIGRFAICKHSKVMGADANPRRGWYPGRCEHCGLDMTVDSGD